MLARRDTRREAARLRRLSPLQTLENQSQIWGIRCHSCTGREGLPPSWKLSYKTYILRFTRESRFSFNQRIARILMCYVNQARLDRTGLPLMSISGRSWGRVARAMSEDTTRRGGLWSGKVSGQGVVNDLAIRISSQVTRHYYSSTFKVNREAEMAKKQDCPTPARFLRTSLAFCCWTIHAKTKISRNGVRSSAHAICAK